MAKTFSITTVGLSRILKSLQSFPKDLQWEVNAEMAVSASNVEREAIRKAPTDEAGIRLSIYSRQSSGKSWEVGVQKNYAPYVEFGTKRRFKAPKGFESYARQFKGKRVDGPSGDLDEAILGWVKRKRIRFEKAGQQSIIGGKKKRAIPKLKTRYLTYEQTAFIIARHISFHGIKPQPFLFPAVIEERRKLGPRITKAIRRAFRK
jgi:hypothetical protein